MLQKSKIFFGILLGIASTSSAFFNDFDQQPHNYWEREPTDPVSKYLAARAGEGSVLRQREFVEELLAEFDIPAASQALVFSKTSLQRKEVGPENPRAMYFNEDVYLGWMPGGRIEIASADPKLGLIFYYEDIRPPEAETPATFARDKVCLECHAGAATNFLPGPLARSVYPDDRGRARGSVKSFDLMSHTVPIAERWGGWFVSGGHGFSHLGNQTGERTPAARPFPSTLDVTKYPVPTSDALALMVFDHQIGIHKQIIESHYKVRQAEHDGDYDTIAPKEAAKLVAQLTFQGEVPFDSASIQPSPEFIKAFRRNRRTTTEGHSLKDFAYDQGRLFQHRCSYMIYSSSFQGMPDEFRKLVYASLATALENDPATLAIIRHTLSDFIE